MTYRILLACSECGQKHLQEPQFSTLVLAEAYVQALKLELGTQIWFCENCGCEAQMWPEIHYGKSLPELFGEACADEIANYLPNSKNFDPSWDPELSQHAEPQQFSANPESELNLNTEELPCDICGGRTYIRTPGNKQKDGTIDHVSICPLCDGKGFLQIKKKNS
ncbi:MAG TPA: hypothetical protein VLB82_07715 [Thermodesulfobacteriota bacterium]|nr:hypothetical protein [Thermodesulfobacteriota bacterium]